MATIDLTPYWTIAQVQAAITAALVPVTLANGQSWNGGPTFNLLRGSNVLRNISVAGALTASFQNLDDTILIESDSYARSETYTQAETGAAITAAIDALDLSQFRNEAQALDLIAGELGPYWDQTEVANYVAGQLTNYQTSSQVSSAISSALSSYDNSNEVDSKIITALLDFYTRAEVDQEIADALNNRVTTPRPRPIPSSTPARSWILCSRPRSCSTGHREGRSRRSTTPSPASWTPGPGHRGHPLLCARSGTESGNIFNLVQEQFTPRIIRNLLLEAPLQGDAILGNQSTLRLRCDSWTKAEADARFLRRNDVGALEARYFRNRV